MKKLLSTVALIALVISGMAHAQTATTAPVGDPGHPRINQVDQRLQNQENRTNAGVQSGTIGAKQEMRDQKTDAKVSQEMSTDEAKNNGHITKAEQARMNKQLDKDSSRIKRQKAAPGTATAPATATPAQ